MNGLLGQMQAAIQNSVEGTYIGVAFSGGVDSSLVARVCADMGYDVTLLTVGFDGSHDVRFAERIGGTLGLRHHTEIIDPRGFGETVRRIRGIISTENISWIENAIAFHYTARLAADLGLRTVVTANGIDELFCGYTAYRGAFCMGEPHIARMAESKVRNELDMMDAIRAVTAEYRVRLVQPLLSEGFISYAASVPLSDKIRGPDDLLRKHAVRRLASEIGVSILSYRKRKKALQYGSGIHKAAKDVLAAPRGAPSGRRCVL